MLYRHCWLFGLAFLFFIGSALASIPIVDFSWSPIVPSVNQSITFDPTISTDSNILLLNWQFDSDGNVNLSLGSENFTDTFSDGDYTANPIWTVVAGTWLGDQNLSTISNGGTISSVLDTNFIGKDVNFYWRIYSKSTTNETKTDFMRDMGGNGYKVSINSTGDVELRRIEVDYILVSAGTVTFNAWHDINICYRDGNFSIYVDNVYKGSKVDTNNQNSNYAFYLYQAGTAGVFWDDFRIGGQTIGNYDDNQTHSFSSAGIKQTCLTAGNMDGNVTTCHSFSVSGFIKLSFFDENTLISFAPTTVKVNGVSQTLDVNTLVYSLSGISTLTDYTITASDVTHSERTWIFLDKNQDNGIDLNVLLLDTNKGRTIPFKFYKPNQTDLLANSLISFWRGKKLVGTIQANSSGKTSFFLNQDANYTIDIDSEPNGISDYNYTGTIVTIQIPKDEMPPYTNITTFEIHVGGLATYDLNGLSGSATIKIFSDTEQYYSFKILDNANDYFPRTYSIKTLGGQATYSLQPYLASQIEAASVVVYAINPYNFQTVPNILIQTYRTINGVTTLIEEAITDSSGTAAITLLANTTYTIIGTLNGEVIHSGSVTGLFNNYTIYVYSLGGGGATIQPGNFANVSFYPQITGILDNNLHYSFYQHIDGNSTLTFIHARIYQDGNLLSDLNVTNVLSYTFPIFELDINSLPNQNPITVIVDVNISGVQQQFRAVYFISHGLDLIESLNNFKNEVGFVGRGLIVLFLTIVVLGLFTRFKSEGTDTSALGIITMLILGFFTLIGFLNSGQLVQVAPGVYWDKTWGVMLIATLTTLVLLRAKKV